MDTNMTQTQKAIYAFSGDPITYGHIDIIKRAAKVFDALVVAIGTNPEKKYTFSIKERVEMATKSVGDLDNVKVVSFSGTLVDYAYENSISLVIKGIRDEQDFNYELALHQIGESQKLGIDTFFIPAKQNKTHISSSAVKALQQEHGMVHDYVTPFVKQKLEAKLSNQYFVGVTGEIAVGKTYVCEKFKEIGKKKRIEVHNIELDKLGHQILEDLKDPLYIEVRGKILSHFGKEVESRNGFIDRKKLGKIVFANPEDLNTLNDIMHEAILMRVRREVYNKQGLILLNAALFAESGILYLCNNNIVLVSAEKELQKQRLKERGFSSEQIERRLVSQFTTSEKSRILREQIKDNNYGKLWKVQSKTKENEQELQDIFDEIVNYFSI
ncbi:pantetheine-phosphate adenylyltransferase [Candidatus Dojkabacteria bacterium]|nr:pantetheine-phosphate adenylyltransferase [Candidatus Dojkabacteria bacterium]